MLQMKVKQIEAKGQQLVGQNANDAGPTDGNGIDLSKIQSSGKTPEQMQALITGIFIKHKKGETLTAQEQQIFDQVKKKHEENRK
eukprot:Pgem_evm1s15304